MLSVSDCSSLLSSSLSSAPPIEVFCCRSSLVTDLLTDTGVVATDETAVLDEEGGGV